MIGKFLHGGMVTSTIAIAVGLLFNSPFPPTGLIVAAVFGGAAQATATPTQTTYRRIR